MLVSQSRPRDLGWHHAGPLLFGDWGTSRLYVLGLAFSAMHFASPIYLLALSVLMTGVAWAYTIICRCFHTGGGVYTAARRIHPLLAVIGATLLMADYIVTVCISLVDAYHYFGLPEDEGKWATLAACVLAIGVLGVINWFGARNAGRAALVVAIAAMGFSALIALAAIPFIPEGLRSIKWDSGVPPLDRWINFTGIVLALSGVEAVANMTGLMKEPVARTAKRTIWPVLCEVAILNLVFIVAICGLKAMMAAGSVSGEWTDSQIQHAAMKVLAIEAGQHWLGATAGFVLGKISAVVFGLLLLSAANTATLAMVSVIYALAQDRELPAPLTKLNYSGVPWIPLLIAVGATTLVLVFVRDLETLAHLYAIGVCGAITIEVFSALVTRELDISRWERIGLGVVGFVVGSVWITIALTKYHALLFVSGLVLVTMLTRAGVRWRAARIAALKLPEPQIGWLAEVRREPLQLDANKPRIMLAARGRFQAEFAVDMARRRGATLFVIYVRTLRVLDMRPDAMPRIEDDRAAQESLGTATLLAREHGVPCVPIYVCSPKIADEILDYTVTYGCDTLILGKSRRRLFSRALEGDVISEVAKHLPDGVALITREATPHPLAPPAERASPRTSTEA
ncbi:MAG: universal stress protein [Phycisphaerales bacterium]